MPSIARSGALVASYALGAIICVVSALGSASAQEGSPLGCWRHESDEGKYKNFLEICLGEGGAAETTEFRNGNGWGQNARWEVTGSGTLSLKFASDDKVVCQFGKAKDAELALSNCSISDYSRVYTREGTFDDRNARQSICWGRQHPADGSFEVAQIAEQTPAIVELEHKQGDDDQLSAEEGAVVVVWHRVGQYACVENLTDDPGATNGSNRIPSRVFPALLAAKIPGQDSIEEQSRSRSAAPVTANTTSTENSAIPTGMGQAGASPSATRSSHTASNLRGTRSRFR